MKKLDWRTIGLAVMWCLVIGATACAVISLRIQLGMAPLLGYRTVLLPALACCFCLLQFVALIVPINGNVAQSEQMGGGQ